LRVNVMSEAISYVSNMLRLPPGMRDCVAIHFCVIAGVMAKNVCCFLWF
jgi:hypothetical protein